MGQGGSEVVLADVGEAGDPVAQHLLCARHCAGCFPGLLSPKSHSQLLRCAVHSRVNRCLERLSDLSKVTQSGRAEI